MTNHEIEGKNFYLRVNEPIKFIKTLVKNIKKSREKGFKVKILLGGPEKFPCQIFDEINLNSKKFLFFIYSISYWTHIAFDVKGGSEDENEKELDNILTGIKEEVLLF